MSARLVRSPASNTAGGGNGINPPSSVRSPFETVYVDEALIRHLEASFRFTPNAAHDLRDLDRAVGHREVIDHLLALLQQQQNNT